MSLATLSSDGRFRYELRRRIDPPGSGGMVPWVMLNPSTADAENDDPTIRKVVGFSRRWGARSVRVYNLYALRATDPDDLFAALARGEDCVGDGDQWLTRLGVYARTTGSPIVLGWGARPVPAARIARVLELLEDAPLMSVGVTKSGAPCHPLMLPYSARLRRWTPPPVAQTAASTA